MQTSRKFKKVVLGLLVHVTPSFFPSRILRSEALLFTNHIFVRTAILRKLFDIKFSCKHCNFLRVCLLVKMASKTVTRSIVTVSSLLSEVERQQQRLPNVVEVGGSGCVGRPRLEITSGQLEYLFGYDLTFRDVAHKALGVSESNVKS